LLDCLRPSFARFSTSQKISLQTGRRDGLERFFVTPRTEGV